MHAFAQRPKVPRQATPAKSTIPGRAHGDHAVQRLLRADAEEFAASPTTAAPTRFGHDFGRIRAHPPAAGPIQPKLAINKPGDEHEQEADRVAERMMRKPELQLRRACGGGRPRCQAEQPGREREILQTKRVRSSDSGPTAVPPIVHEVLRSAGQPLDPATRAFMESRFGHDFGHVRVYTDAKAVESARAVNALAYTVGRDVVFGMGQYRPTTQTGSRLLAHELTHVMQQDVHGALTGKIQRAAVGESSASTASVTDEAFLGEVVDFLESLREFRQLVAEFGLKSSNADRLDVALGQLDSQWASMDYYDRFGSDEFGLLDYADQVLQLYELVVPEASMQVRTESDLAAPANVRHRLDGLNDQLARLRGRSFIRAKGEEIKEARAAQREAALEKQAIEAARRETPEGRREAALVFTRRFVENEHRWWPDQDHPAAAHFAKELGRYYLYDEDLGGADIQAVLERLGEEDPALLDRAFYQGELLVYLLSEGVAGLDPRTLLTTLARQEVQPEGAEGKAVPLHVSGAGFHAGFEITWLDLYQRDPIVAPEFSSPTPAKIEFVHDDFVRGVLSGFGGALNDAFWDLVSALNPKTYIELISNLWGLLTDQLNDEQWRYQLGQALAEELHTSLKDVADDSPSELGFKIGVGFGYLLAQIPLAWLGAKAATLATGVLRASRWGKPLVEFGERVADALPWRDPRIVEDEVIPDTATGAIAAPEAETTPAVPGKVAVEGAAAPKQEVPHVEPAPVADVPGGDRTDTRTISSTSPPEAGAVKASKLPTLSAAEKSLLEETGDRHKYPGALPKPLADQELDIVRRAEKTAIKDMGDGYIYEVDLGNGHTWRGKEDGTWCRFSPSPTNCTEPILPSDLPLPSGWTDLPPMTPILEPIGTGTDLPSIPPGMSRPSVKAALAEIKRGPVSPFGTTRLHTGREYPSPRAAAAWTDAARKMIKEAEAHEVPVSPLQLGPDVLGQSRNYVYIWYGHKSDGTTLMLKVGQTENLRRRTTENLQDPVIKDWFENHQVSMQIVAGDVGKKEADLLEGNLKSSYFQEKLPGDLVRRRGAKVESQSKSPQELEQTQISPRESQWLENTIQDLRERGFLPASDPPSRDKLPASIKLTPRSVKEAKDKDTQVTRIVDDAIRSGIVIQGARALGAVSHYIYIFYDYDGNIVKPGICKKERLETRIGANLAGGGDVKTEDQSELMDDLMEGKRKKPRNTSESRVNAQFMERGVHLQLFAQDLNDIQAKAIEQAIGERFNVTGTPATPAKAIESAMEWARGVVAFHVDRGAFMLRRSEFR